MCDAAKQHNVTRQIANFATPSDEDLLMIIIEQNLVAISPVIFVVFYRRLGIHMT